jgi:hypothetical protein
MALQSHVRTVREIWLSQLKGYDQGGYSLMTNKEKAKLDILEALDRHFANSQEWTPMKPTEYGLKYSKVTFCPKVGRAIYDGIYGYFEAEIERGTVARIYELKSNPCKELTLP